MKLKVLQDYRGKFNMLGGDETHSFIMAIVDENGKPIQDANGIKAIINYNNEESYWEFEFPYDKMDSVFDICLKDSKRWIGSTPYIQQHMFFLKLYNENHSILDQQALADFKVDTEKRIVEAERKLKELKDNLKLDTFLTVETIESEEVARHNEQYQNWILQEEEKLKDVIEGSDTYNSITTTISKYRNRLLTV